MRAQVGIWVCACVRVCERLCCGEQPIQYWEAVMQDCECGPICATLLRVPNVGVCVDHWCLFAEAYSLFAKAYSLFAEAYSDEQPALRWRAVVEMCAYTWTLPTRPFHTSCLHRSICFQC